MKALDKMSSMTLFDATGSDEDFAVPKEFRGRGALTAMQADMWVPVAREGKTAVIAAVSPNEALAARIRVALGCEDTRLLPADPVVVRHILDNTLDVGPGFPPEASRTELAKVRTYLAGRRSFLAGFRTTLARGRTGLSLFRTGLALLTVVLVLLRIFGLGLALPLEACIFGVGVFFVADGILWYLPARRMSRRGLPDRVPEPDPKLGNVGVLAVSANQLWPCFHWLPAVPGAQALRRGWALLSPVARRRFLAMDRTTLALERTTLAELRSIMARSRTGLALGRTGIAVSGVGIAMIRQFHYGPWDIVSLGLVMMGTIMGLEGLSWYLPARRAGSLCQTALNRAAASPSPRILVTPTEPGPEGTSEAVAPVPEWPGMAPGVLGTTGLALERTFLAEARNVQARLRTQLARARTGLSFIRTGLNAVAVGLGLLAWFGTAAMGWTVFNLFLLAGGLVLTVDGLRWYLPSVQARRETTFCTADFELAVPDYAVVESNWGRASAGLGADDAA
jgi:uncharacterized membrane protein YidH (DUF202 family)